MKKIEKNDGTIKQFPCLKLVTFNHQDYFAITNDLEWQNRFHKGLKQIKDNVKLLVHTNISLNLDIENETITDELKN